MSMKAQEVTTVCFSFVVSVVGCSFSSSFFVFSSFVVCQPFFFRPVHRRFNSWPFSFFCSRNRFGFRSWLGKLRASVRRSSSFVVHTLAKCAVEVFFFEKAETNSFSVGDCWCWVGVCCVVVAAPCQMGAPPLICSTMASMKKTCTESLTGDS